MKCLLLATGLLLLVPSAGRAAAATAPAPSAEETALQALTTRQQELFAQAEKMADGSDENDVRSAMQRLAQAYDDFLKKYPKYAPAYTAYGVMLSRIDMGRQAAAVMMTGDTAFAAMDKEEGSRTPAFNRAWALLKNQLGNYTAEEGHPLEAATYFLAAIDLAPDEPLYHYQLGTLLTEARDDFIKSGVGTWTRANVENSMHEAFRKAAEFAPGRVEFVYRYAESFYDLAEPDWNEALKVWAKLEEQAGSDVERETMRLQAANVLIRQGKPDHARILLATVTEPALAAMKQKLVAQLPAEAAK